MKVTPTELPEVLLIEPRSFGDARGWFFESWSLERYAAAGLPRVFVQDNVSRSAFGVLRGLHVQQPFSQGKLVGVLDGEVFDVAVDVRRGSPTFGRWVARRLSADNKAQLYLPPGFAHGFQVLSPSALFCYKCTEYYRAECELSIAHDDPALAIEWPLAERVLSAKDAAAQRLSDLDAARLPVHPDARR